MSSRTVSSHTSDYALSVKVEGAVESAQALEEMREDLEKLTVSAVGSAMREIHAGAVMRAPGSLAGDIQLETLEPENGEAFAYRIKATSAPAAILEFAGSASRGLTPQGMSLIETLDARYGTPGRFIWASWDASSRAVESAVEAAVKDTGANAQAKLNAAG